MVVRRRIGEFYTGREASGRGGFANKVRRSSFSANQGYEGQVDGRYTGRARNGFAFRSLPTVVAGP